MVVYFVYAFHDLIAVYVPTAQAVKAQGTALGMRRPTHPFETRAADCPNGATGFARTFAPLGLVHKVGATMPQGVALGYHRLPRWGITGLGIAVNPILAQMSYALIPKSLK